MPALLPHNVAVDADALISRASANVNDLEDTYEALMRMDKDCAIYAALLISETIWRDFHDDHSLRAWLDDLREHFNQRLAHK